MYRHRGWTFGSIPLARINNILNLRIPDDFLLAINGNDCNVNIDVCDQRINPDREVIPEAQNIVKY